MAPQEGIFLRRRVGHTYIASDGNKMYLNYQLFIKPDLFINNFEASASQLNTFHTAVNNVCERDNLHKKKTDKRDAAGVFSFVMASFKAVIMHISRLSKGFYTNFNINLQP